MTVLDKIKTFFKQAKVAEKRVKTGGQVRNKTAGSMKLNTRVFELCNGKYQSLAELAQMMGISNALLYSVRRGERGIHERFIIGATKAFPGYKLDDLFYVSED